MSLARTAPRYSAAVLPLNSHSLSFCLAALCLQTMVADETTMRLIDLHKYEAARNMAVADEVYRANANLLMHDEAVYRCFGGGGGWGGAWAFRVCAPCKRPGRAECCCRGGMLLMCHTVGVRGAFLPECCVPIDAPAQVTQSSLSACNGGLRCTVKCCWWVCERAVRESCLHFMCCRFAFVEGITSGTEDGTDSLPHLTNVKPDPDGPASKPAAGALLPLMHLQACTRFLSHDHGLLGRQHRTARHGLSACTCAYISMF
jgi:hypothetical protein